MAPNLADSGPVPRDPTTMWQAMRRLLGHLVTVLDSDAFMNQCLDTLVELLGADRGLILLHDESGGSYVVNARARNRALQPEERDEISRTIVRKVQQTGKYVQWDPTSEITGSESMYAMGIVTALAGPLKTFTWGQGAEGERQRESGNGYTRGVLYVDVRDPGRSISADHLEFFKSATILASVVLELGQRMRAAKEELREARARDAGPSERPSLDDLLRPDSMRALRTEVAACMQSDASILIQGESGTGKTLLARAIAEESGRLPAVRCVLGGSDDLNTITSELFGHERGAFSGAMNRRIGLVEYANEGTLILDEILNLPLHAQQLLLDVTQFGTYRPLGHDRPEPKVAKVRLIALTNGDLSAAVKGGRFREDLYYRLATVTLHLPPLRDRREDIVPLCEAYLRRVDPAREWSLQLPLRRALSAPDIDWPGNVRQLEGVMQRVRARALSLDRDANMLTEQHLEPRDLARDSAAGPPRARAGQGADAGADAANLAEAWKVLQQERAELEARERALIDGALQKHAGVVAHAARELGVQRTSLLSRKQTLSRRK